MTRHLDPDQLAAQRAEQLQRHGHHALWCEVLLLAIHDARLAAARIGTPQEILQAHHKAFEADADAVRWLGSPDFLQVCALAGVDPGWVLRKIEEANILQPEQETKHG